MPENILIAIAWPYANAEIHVGNLTGSHLPGDIVARYHRLKGDNVLVVSGTDSHGTPVTMSADKLKKPVEEVYKFFHDGFLETFKGYGITYDLFTSTHTENHFKVSQSIFLALKENGYLFTKIEPQWFSPGLNKFLPDRYIEGTCYICGFEGARSDQCDKCGNVLEPDKLINPKSKWTGDTSTPELRETEHFYIDLSKLEPKVVEFLKERSDHLRDTVLGESLGKINAEGLKPRPITRDLDWGIPVPVEGWDGKCLYVWFEAVIGYLSAAIEWSNLSGGNWKDWWSNPAAKHYHFIGKDNIFFHTSLWPAELMGVGEKFAEIFSGEKGVPLTLPYDVPANQFMNLEGQKISGSRNWAVWGRDALTRYDPDALRFYLTINMPENKDSDWDWSEFVALNNNQLVATWGNLANRVLSFAFKHWEGHVPDIDPANLREADKALLTAIEGGFESVGALYNIVKLRDALRESLRLATEVNRYLDANAPWTAIKTDRDSAALTIYTALKAIDSLKLLFAPILPFTSEKLHGFFGYTTPLSGEQYTEVISDKLGTHTGLRYRPVSAQSGALSSAVEGRWQPSQLKPGQPLNQPGPLFKKLEERVVEEERARLGR
jgi:methionyl-tRNA synthetase